MCVCVYACVYACVYVCTSYSVRVCLIHMCTYTVHCVCVYMRIYNHYSNNISI